MTQKKKVTIEQLYRELEQYIPPQQEPLVQAVFRSSGSSFQALVTCILSARTADKTTEKRIPELFKIVKEPKDLKKVSQQRLEKILFPIGFYKNKAKLLKKFPDVLEKEFNGVIPETIEELIKLPGVGRKTANLIVSVCFDKDGICVDTHVHRIMNHIGYVNTKTPLETEAALREKLPKKLWKKTNSLMVLLGQSVCAPTLINKPACPLNWYELKESKPTVKKRVSR
ncbi:MAG: endonuclease III [Candidatus Dojkabacteria bacterium]|nr:MAG: endonuclease III [Candidatus Dojkabacteria bacterium]